MLDINKIEDLRKENKLTQEEMAKKIGLTANGYQKAIYRKDFKTSTITLMAKEFKLYEAYFFKNVNKYENIDKSMVEEPTEVYNINIEEYRKIVLNKLSKIIQLLEKK